VDPLRRLARAWPAVDDAAARPRAAESREARAGTGIRTLPPARRAAAAARRARAVNAPDYLSRLARLAVRTRADDLAPPAMAAAKDVVLDTIGAMLAGSRLPEHAKLADLARERPGPSTA